MQNKKIFGIAYLTVFVLAVAGIYFYGRGLRVADILRPDLGRMMFWKNTEAPSFVKQAVVEEESAIIDVVDKVSPAVVSVVEKTSDFDPFSGPIESKQGVGTGFIVDASGLIVTNNHVVSDPGASYSVVLKDGQSFEVKKIYRDGLNDLALLEVKGANLPVVQLGDSSKLKVGQKAIAIGNALGEFSNTVTVGVVSGLSRQMTASGAFGTAPKTYNDVIQTDAAINPGNSGGPLLNIAGQVIGINVATSRGAENIGFAIAVNRLKPVLQSFKESGRIIRPYLGVSFRTITRDIASFNRLPEGAYITQIGTGTPADKAGLETGDIITKIGGKAINEKNTLDYEIQQDYKVGDKVKLTVDRRGTVLNLEAVLEEAPEQ